jgi:hypothetical protein
MSRENPKWLGTNWCAHEPSCTDKAACCDRGEAEEQERIRHPLVTWKAGVAIGAGQVVAIRPDGCVVPVVSPKAAEPRRVQVGDVWQARGDVTGYTRGHRHVIGIVLPGTRAVCADDEEDIELRPDGTADPAIWAFVRAAEEKPPSSPARRVQVGDVWRVGSGMGYPIIAIGRGFADFVPDGTMRLEPDGTPSKNLDWQLVRAARPKAAVGQRWRWGGPEAFYVARVTPYDADLYEGPRHACSVTLVDGTLPEPWEFVGEAESLATLLTQWPTPPDQRVIDFLSTAATLKCAASDPHCAAGRCRHQPGAWSVGQLGPKVRIEGWGPRLRRTAEAFAFLAAPEMAVHLRRVAVDNAIAACPPDLDPVGWRAAVLALVDRRMFSPEDSVTPDRTRIMARWIREGRVGPCVAAYRRATVPSPRVRRRGEEIR